MSVDGAAGVFVAAEVGRGVCVKVIVGVGVRVGVCVGVAVGLVVGVEEGVSVNVGVEVGEGVGEAAAAVWVSASRIIPFSTAAVAEPCASTVWATLVETASASGAPHDEHRTIKIASR